MLDIPVGALGLTLGVLVLSLDIALQVLGSSLKRVVVVDCLVDDDTTDHCGHSKKNLQEGQLELRSYLLQAAQRRVAKVWNRNTLVDLCALICNTDRAESASKTAQKQEGLWIGSASRLAFQQDPDTLSLAVTTRIKVDTALSNGRCSELLAGF